MGTLIGVCLRCPKCGDKSMYGPSIMKASTRKKIFYVDRETSENFTIKNLGLTRIYRGQTGLRFDTEICTHNKTQWDVAITQEKAKSLQPTRGYRQPTSFKIAQLED